MYEELARLVKIIKSQGYEDICFFQPVYAITGATTCKIQMAKYLAEHTDLKIHLWKLARLLKVRFQAGLPGVSVLPCELIEKNGQTLKEYVLRYLAGDPAAEYERNEFSFYDTLVDRIVS
ncbi:MAG: hypothetical protein IJ972_01285, partial [Campylobacter sp.]|nr:hypothetical protein [Campylobacter sp.]